MFYVAICDDEPEAIVKLAGFLKELRQKGIQLETVPFSSGAELVDYYQRGGRFDLIVLDMVMRPLNGIETARRLRGFDEDVPIIIVTATVEFAMDGYQVNAYRYILKPVDKDYFLKEVVNVFNRLTYEKNSYYNFTNENGLHKLKLSEIYYFESDMRTVKIHSQAGALAFTGKISDVEEQLAAQHFERTHKSYVVNLKYIRNIFKDIITMENGEELPLSKYKSKELRKKFLEYMKASV